MRTLAELVIYPVKSCAGVSVASAGLTDRGLQGDRRFMVVNASGGFVTQRAHPALARVQASFEQGWLRLTADGEAVFVPAEPVGEVREVTVWRSTVRAVDCGEQVADWFSAMLGARMRLVYMPETTARSMNAAYADAHEKVSFADGYPYLVTLEASLGDLNRRLGGPVLMNRFRPNLVIRGGEAWEEDRYERLRVGDVAFRSVKPCARCVMVTTDQRTGARSPKEPLSTLASFRTQDLGVIFGQNLIAEQNEGVLTVGDAVRVL